MNTSTVAGLPSIPYLTYEAMEGAAQELLRDYEQVFGKINLPVPIEKIIEKHLKLALEIGDLKSELGHPDILGGIYFGERRIVIDSSLESQEGRFNFTAAHEVAHWLLHRQFFFHNPDQLGLFSVSEESNILCRETQKRERHELQADHTSGCLLMPRDRLAVVVREHYGKDALVFRPSTRFGRYREFRDYFASRLNRMFGVSVQAMAIRLEVLKLVRDGHDLFDGH